MFGKMPLVLPNIGKGRPAVALRRAAAPRLHGKRNGCSDGVLAVVNRSSSRRSQRIETLKAIETRLRRTLKQWGGTQFIVSAAKGIRLRPNAKKRAKPPVFSVISHVGKNSHGEVSTGLPGFLGRDALVASVASGGDAKRELEPLPREGEPPCLRQAFPGTPATSGTSETPDGNRAGCRREKQSLALPFGNPAKRKPGAPGVSGTSGISETLGAPMPAGIPPAGRRPRLASPWVAAGMLESWSLRDSSPSQTPELPEAKAILRTWLVEKDVWGVMGESPIGSHSYA